MIVIEEHKTSLIFSMMLDSNDKHFL